MAKEIGRDMVKVIDVPGVDPQPAWDEEVPVMRYIHYTAEELAQRENEKQEAQQRQDALDKLPDTGRPASRPGRCRCAER